MTATPTTTRARRVAAAAAAQPAADGLDMQQRAMGSAGQLAALLDQPYSGDAQQVAMGSASQSLLGAATRQAGSYVSGAPASSTPPGNYVSSVVASGQPGNYVSSAVQSEAVGSYVTTPAA